MVDELKMACEYGLDDCVKVLLSYGPRIAAKHPRSGNSALHLACRSGALSTVKLLLGKGNASSRQRLLCIRNRKGETALFVACAMGHVDIVEAMFSIYTSTSIYKALITAQNEGKTALLIAIEAGAFDIVRFLLYWRGNQRTPVQTYNINGVIRSSFTLRLLICHIYHDSIVMGLSVDRKVCCEQLIDLYTVKEQEYAKNVRFLAGGDDVGDSGYSTEERLLRIATLRIWWLIGSCVCVSRSHDIST